jgi:hypothetical protein
MNYFVFLARLSRLPNIFYRAFGAVKDERGWLPIACFR